MPVSNASASTSADRELVFTRTFDAPRELVFEAWTNPQHLVHWWGPNGFTTSIHQMDVKPGGARRLTMRGPDGRDYHNRLVFLEVEKPGRLVYKHEPEPGSEPVNFQVTVTFAAKGGKTEVTMLMLFPSAAGREHVVKTYGAEEGGKQTLARLSEHLAAAMRRTVFIVPPDEPTITMIRTFDAPRHLVFDAWTSPEHVARWWGPGPSELAPCEVAPPERLVHTFVFDVEGIRDKPALVTAVFEDLGVKTRVIQTIRHQSVAARDGHVKSGMETGAAQSLNRLDQELSRMVQRDLVFTRTFDAPRQLVFKAFTEPERLQRWWGPRGFTNPRCEIDVRPGGAIRIDMRAPNGAVHPMTGTYREIVEPERLVFTSAALDANGPPMFEMLNTITFEDLGGRTKLTLHTHVLMATAVAAQYLAGQEMGWSLSLDRLAEEVAR